MGYYLIEINYLENVDFTCKNLIFYLEIYNLFLKINFENILDLILIYLIKEKI